MKENFVEYCKNYILDNLDAYTGQSVYACDFTHTITNDANWEGSLTYSKEEAKEYLREWWDECGEYWEYEKNNFGENFNNPFDNPEGYMVCMVIEGVSFILSSVSILEDNWNNEIELTEEVIWKIRSEVEDFETDDSLF